MELIGDISPGGNFIGTGGVSFENSLVIPPQFFSG